MASGVLRRKSPYFLRSLSTAFGCKRCVTCQLFLHQKPGSVSGQTQRWPASFHGRQMSVSPSTTEEDSIKAVVPSVVQYDHVDAFVPMTRRSMVRHLMQQPDWLTEDELRQFEAFAIALDSAIVGKYHDTLQELKSLFDPINPDKDTVTTRKWNRRERLDNEFWLLQQFSSVMEKANFHEVPRAVITEAMAEHSTQNVIVSVNTDAYDVLRFWVLGKESPQAVPNLKARAKSWITRQPVPAPKEFYKRVVVAVRPKSQDKLLLKAFKEVPVNSLELLLPEGKVAMKSLDKNILMLSAGLTGAGLLAKAVTYMASIHSNWTVVMATISGLVGLQAWTTYKNRRNAYLLEMARMLYFKNIANNRGLLALLVDRAEDELFKEALLAYTFLLTNRPPSTREKLSQEQHPDDLGALSQSLLEHRVQDWVKEKTGSKIHFDATESVSLLQQLGLLSKDMEENLHVLPLDGSTRLLPQRPQTLAARQEESDMVEGYDREPEQEQEEEYKQFNRVLKKYFKWK